MNYEKLYYDTIIQRKGLGSKDRETFFTDIYDIVGNIDIVSNKISESLYKITDMQVRAAIKILYLTSKSVFGSKEPKYKGLTPMFMYALREHKGLPYSFWDKEDVAVPILLGRDLNGWVTDAVWPSREEALLARSLHLQQYGEEKWCGTASTPVSKLVAMQCWIASPSLRHPSMLLNFKDWDDIPEPFDSIEEEEDETNRNNLTFLGETNTVWGKFDPEMEEDIAVNRKEDDLGF